MKEKLILGAIVLILASWLALDAVATIILPLRFAALPLPASSLGTMPSSALPSARVAPSKPRLPLLAWRSRRPISSSQKRSKT